MGLETEIALPKSRNPVSADPNVAPLVGPVFDVLRDRAAVREAVAPDVKVVRKQRGKGELYLLGLVPSSTILLGFAIGAVTDPIFVGTALVSSALVAGLWFGKDSKRRKASARIRDQWIAHFERFGSHAVSGEPVSVIASDDNGTVVTIRFDDGCTTEVDVSALRDKHGSPYEVRGGADAAKAAQVLCRWSRCRWRTDDGRVGIVRDFQYRMGKYSVAPELLLKFPDGHAWADPMKLTPVR